MGFLFVLISQTLNLTPYRIGFRVRYGLCPVPNLGPYQTGIIKLDRIIKYGQKQGPDWTIGVFRDGKYTGVELTSEDLLNYTRLVFRRVRNAEGKNVLLVEGVPENCNDFLLRHRYFGFLRNAIWNRRRPVLIGVQKDSQVATKLRILEAPPDLPAIPLTSAPKQHGSHVNHGKQNPHHVTTKAIKKVATDKHSETTRTRMRTKEQRIPVVDSAPFIPCPRSSTSEKVQIHMDVFVHGFLFLVALVIVFLVRGATR